MSTTLKKDSKSISPDGVTLENVREVLARATRRLAAAGRENPQLLAELMVSAGVPCHRLELSLHYECVVSGRERTLIQERLERLVAGEPVQYVLGVAGFMGLDLMVDSRVLIPRPETELLVEEVLQCEACWSSDAPVIADVCTGSGCIALALAEQRSHASYLAIDNSEDALCVAMENARRCGLDRYIRFRMGDLLAAVEAESVDLVVSNPPYVAESEWPSLPGEVRHFEPREALAAGPDGLEVISRIVDQAWTRLRRGGYLMLEIGETQGAAVRDMLEAAGFQDVVIKKDLANRDRIVRARTC